jgi:hypothetical protein
MDQIGQKQKVKRANRVKPKAPANQRMIGIAASPK